MAHAPPAAPAVRIVEQPANRALRFRYECEGRSAGSIPGVNSTADKKTYPTIEITGHKGKAIVVVSCVTKDEPYRPHPHNLVGRPDRCNKGVCTVRPDLSESPLVSFSNLGIQCVKRKDIADALKVREAQNVDPFKTGFSHKSQPQSIDLNAVRLCFQVFLPDERSGKYRHSLPPQVSDVIYDKKAMTDLLIMRLSCCAGGVRGGTEVILLCEKVTREDIAVVFFQKEGETIVWEESANILLVHKQAAIAFTTPPYRNPHAREHVQVFLQLKRLSDNARSAAVPFEYIPESAESEYLKTKRRKTLSPCSAYEQERAYMPEIKAEPRDRTPPHVISSPPHRAYPESNPDPYQQQRWIMPMDNISMNMPQGTPLSWPPPSYPAPNIQIPNMSPNMQQMSPTMHPMSPNMQQISPNMQAMSPNMHRMSPNMHAMSPNVHPMSPNMQQQMNMQAMSPGHMGQALSPGHNMGQALSPGHNMGQPLSPGHNMGQALSPGHNMGQALSPGHNMGQAMSPGHMGQVMSPVDHMGQQNMGQITPNLGQQNVNQGAEGGMEVSCSDPASITALLLDRADAPMLNSGELSQLLALARPHAELSDSLRGLSTSDLLK